MQLTGKKIALSDSDVTSIQQEKASENGDAASENNNVAGAFQVYCAFPRLLFIMYV